MLFSQLTAAKAAAERPCSQCAEKEQLLSKAEKQCSALEKKLNDEKQKSYEIGKYNEELEANLKVVAEDAYVQVGTAHSFAQPFLL